MALAYDSSGSVAGASGASSQSWTHTPSGSSDLVGFVLAYTEKTGTPAVETITGVTWGGNAMVQVNKAIRIVGSGGWLYLYRTGNSTPPSGAQPVQISCDANAFIKGVSVVYTGGLQSSFIGGQNTAGGTVGNSLDVVVAADSTVNSWVVCVGMSDNGGIGAGTGMTSRIASEGAFIIGDSNATVTPSSNYTIGIVGTGSGWQVVCAAQFYPSTVATLARSASASVSNAASRLATASTLKLYSRHPSASVGYSASRVATAARAIAFARAAAASISVAAGRLATAARSLILVRAASASIGYAVSRIATALGFTATGMRYTTRGSSYHNRNAAPGSSYQDRNSSPSSSYGDRYT